MGQICLTLLGSLNFSSGEDNFQNPLSLLTNDRLMEQFKENFIIAESGLKRGQFVFWEALITTFVRVKQGKQFFHPEKKAKLLDLTGPYCPNQ